MGGKKLEQGQACVKPQVRAIEQAFLPVFKTAIHEFCHQSAIGSVGRGNEQLTTRREHLMAEVNNTFWVREMF